jgi:hypothetical protein
MKSVLHSSPNWTRPQQRLLDYWELLHLSPLKRLAFNGLRCKDSQ